MKGKKDNFKTFLFLLKERRGDKELDSDWSLKHEIDSHLTVFEALIFLCIKLYLLLFSRYVMSDLETPWTVARQAPLCMGFPRQEY